MENAKRIYLQWNGRICRMTYWLYSIPIIVAYIFNQVYVASANENLSLLILLVLLYPSMMINIKRSHDRGRTGFFSLLLIVPIISLWPLIEFGFIKGTEGANKYGQPDATWSKT